MIGLIGSRIKWTIIIMLVIGLGTMAWLYKDKLEDAAQLAQTVVQQRTTLSEMEEQMERQKRLRKQAEQVAANYKQQVDQIYKEARNLREYIEKLEAKNNDVKKWAETPMPDAVVSTVTDGMHNDTDNNED